MRLRFLKCQPHCYQIGRYLNVDSIIESWVTSGDDSTVGNILQDMNSTTELSSRHMVEQYFEGSLGVYFFK